MWKLACVSLMRQVLGSLPETNLDLGMLLLVNSSKIRRKVSIFSLNGRSKFPNATAWHSYTTVGHACTQYKKRKYFFTGWGEGPLTHQVSQLLASCRKSKLSKCCWAPARLNFMCKCQRKSLKIFYNCEDAAHALVPGFSTSHSWKILLQPSAGLCVSQPTCLAVHPWFASCCFFISLICVLSNMFLQNHGTLFLMKL